MAFTVVCPHCGGKVPSLLFHAAMGKRKNKKNPLSTEQSKKMVEAREAKRRAKKSNS